VGDFKVAIGDLEQSKDFLTLILKNGSLFHSEAPYSFSTALLQIDLLKYH